MVVHLPFYCSLNCVSFVGYKFLENFNFASFGFFQLLQVWFALVRRLVCLECTSSLRCDTHLLDCFSLVP